MKRSLAIFVCAVALALATFAPSMASAGGRYHGYGYGYGYDCCCVSYCCGWVRGRGFNRSYAHPRYRYDYGNAPSRNYVRREARRGW